MLNGARLVVHPPGTPTAHELGRTLTTRRITTLWLTAGLFNVMMDAEREALASVRQVLAGGDVLSVPHVQALLDAKHPFVPVGGEAENGFRKLVAAHSAEGLVGLSIGQSPGLVAISMKAAISALEGNIMPQLISVPLPSVDYTALKDGTNFWTDLPDNFFTVNEFPPCGVNISGPAIMAQTEENVQ